jgi:hypothetical protein
MEPALSDKPRLNYGRNFPYEIWLVSVGAAQGDVEALRAAEREEIEVLARDQGRSIEPEPEPEPHWYGAITEAMIQRAGGRPAANHAHRGDLLGPSQSISMSDRLGGIDYGAFLDRGGFKK